MTGVMVATAVTESVAELFISASINYDLNSSYSTGQRFANFLGTRRPKYLSKFFKAPLGRLGIK